MSTEEQLAQSMGIPYKISQVNVPGHAINYLTCGTGPALLLIHGANIGWGQWYKIIPALAQHFTVYAPDLPGSGRSSRVDYRTLDPDRDLLEPITHFISALKLERFVTVGCSIGGWIALRLTLTYPEKVSKLVIVDGVGLADYMGFGEKMIGFYPFLSST